MKKYIILTLILSLFGTKASAKDAHDHDITVRNADGKVIYYKYINGGNELAVVRYIDYRFSDYETNFVSTYQGSVVIPEEIVYENKTLKVTSIGSNAFYKSKKLTSVTIPNSVTSIGDYAFEGCYNLPSITIPNSVTSIGHDAFCDCSGLTSVTIPNSVTSIGWEAFKNCSSLTSITIPNGVSSIGYKTFDGCLGLTSVTIPDYVTSIGEEAFSGCYNLTSVTIGNSVTSIGMKAFSGCHNLTSVTIPDYVTSIGEEAFSGCYNLTSATIGNSVTSIGKEAFSGCRLTSVTIGNSVEHIGNNAFFGCRLTSVTIPNSVQRIGFSAFERNIGLTSVTIGNSVEHIGNNAFYDCKITVIISKIEFPTYIIDVFSDSTILKATLYVPAGTIERYKSSMGWSEFVHIEDSNTPPEPKKCEKPTISYSNGKLNFNCSTEGATCQSTITDTDIASYSSNEVQLGVTYNISVCATKAGYENSETATATLCWIDVEPKMEGIENSVAQVRANAVLIQTENGRVAVNGADDGTNISVYSANGVLSGNTISRNGSAVIDTNLQTGSIAIVKIGDKSVKVVVK